MRIAVCIKRVPDTAEADVKVDSSAKAVVEDKLAFTVNEADNYALEEALLLKEKHDAEVVLVTVGQKEAEEVLRMGMAKGAASAVRIETGAVDHADAEGIARALAGWFAKNEFDLIVTGCITSDVADSLVGPMLAEMLGWPHAAYTTELEMTDTGFRVKRELEGGFLEVKELARPCVLSIQTGGNTPRYASIMGIKRARSKPLTEVAKRDLDAGDYAPWTELLKLYAPEIESIAEMIEGDTGEKAARVAEILKEKGLV